MAKFNVAAHWARDESLTPAARYIAFLHSLSSYAAMRRASFKALRERVGLRFGFDEVRRPTFEQMIAAVDYLAQERAEFVVRLDAFAAERRREKAGGRRQPSAAQFESIFPRRNPAPASPLVDALPTA